MIGFQNVPACAGTVELTVEQKESGGCVVSTMVAARAPSIEQALTSIAAERERLGLGRIVAAGHGCAGDRDCYVWRLCL